MISLGRKIGNMETVTLVIDNTIEVGVAIQDKDIPTIFRMHPSTWLKLKGNAVSDQRADEPQPQVEENLEQYVPPASVKSELPNSKLFDFLVEGLPEFSVEYLPAPNLRLSDRRTIKISRDGKHFTMIDAGTPNKKAITQIKAAWDKQNNS